MRLYDSVNNVLKRLDDYPSVGGELIWTRAEVERYVKDGYDAFCRQTKCILDFFYPENLPLAGNYVGRWERNYFDPGMVAVGLINYSGGYWERDYAEASAIGPANLTQPWEAEYLTTTFAVSLHPVPEDNVSVDRAVHEFSELEPEYTRWLEQNDRSFQTTMGQPSRFSMDRDGMSRLRVVPAGDGGATSPDVTGTYGLLRQKVYLGGVSYWPLDETSGTRYDAIGSNHLSDLNTTGYATGVYGNGADIDAATFEGFEIAHNSSLIMDTTLVFSLWFKVGTCPFGGAYIINKSEGGVTGNYGLYLNTITNALEFQVQRADGGGSISATCPTTITNGVWTHVVCGWDSVMGKGFIAINGAALTYSATVGPAHG